MENAAMSPGTPFWNFLHRWVSNTIRNTPNFFFVFIKNNLPYVIGILLTLFSLTLVENGAMSPGTPFSMFFCTVGCLTS